MRIEFDRGTVLLVDAPRDAYVEDIPGVLWDQRIACFRAPARLAFPTLTEFPIGRYGDGEHTAEPITVATAASAYRNMALLGDRFGLVVVDEVHHMGGGRHDEALEMAIAPMRLGLTATPHPPGTSTERLTALVRPVVYEMTVGDLAGDALAPLERITWRLRLDPDERREYDALRAVYRKACG